MKRRCNSRTDTSRMSCPAGRSAAASSRSSRSKITPWRRAPRAGFSSSMPKWVATVYRMLRPPAMTARRSSFSPGNASLSTRPARRHCCISQRSASGVMRPSVMRLAANNCDTAPTEPDDPSASFQCSAANGSSASSSSAPAATWALRKAASVKRPSPKYFIDKLTLPTWNDSARNGLRPRPKIISVERPPMSITRRGRLDGCRRATPAKISRASSRPEITSIGRPSTACARARKAFRLRASRSVWVATARTCQAA